MRTISAALEKVLTAAGGYAVHMRVQVKDAGGTWRDLSSLSGYNFVDSASVKEEVDQPSATADVTLKREIYSYSLAPLMSASKFNNLSGASALLQIGRRIKIETATMARDLTPSGSDWTLAFDGYIDEIDDGSFDVRISCRDLGARLQDTFIENEKAYGLGLGTGVYVRKDSTAYALNDKIVPAVRDGYWYYCTTAGTTGTVPPTWAAGPFADGTAAWTRGGSVLSSNAVENEMQAILDDNVGGITLVVGTGWNNASNTFVGAATSPAWNITPYNQRRESVMDAVRNLAQQIGADVRYQWNESAGAFSLTFKDFDRSATSSLRTFGASQYFNVRELRRSIATIRNKVRVIYSDVADVDANAQPKRKTIEVTDATSVSNYGTRFMEVTEASTSNIDSSSEANKLAYAILGDLCEPTAQQSLELPYFFAAELGDLYTFSANNVHYDANQKLAVVGIQHSFTPTQARTVLTVRGKPSAGHKGWLERDARPGVAQPGQSQPPDGPSSTTAVAFMGGGRVTFIAPKGERWKDSELHVYGTPGTTPSASTLRDTGKKTSFDVTGIDPGTTKYARIALKDDKGNIAYSDEVSFTSSYFTRAALAAELKRGFYATRAADVSVETGSSGATPKQALLNSESWDNGGNYATGTYRFTAPEDGKYHFRGQVTLSGLYPGHSGYCTLKKNGATTIATGTNVLATTDPTGANVLAMTVDAKVSLAVSDYVELWYTTLTPGVASATLVAAASFFSGEETLET